MKLYMRLILVIISGLLVPLSFPPYGLWPLTVISLFALMLATADISPRKAFYLGILQGMIGYGLTLHWLYSIFSSVAIPLYAIMAIFVALFCMCFNILSKQIKSSLLKVLVAALLWTAIEFFRCELFLLRFPWISIGSSIGPTWISPILGVYGASFILIATSASFLFRKTFALAAVLSALVIFIGVCRPGVVEPPSHDDSIVVAVVQSEESTLYSYIDLTKSISDKSPDLVVWPEYALAYDIRSKTNRFKGLSAFCEEMNALFIIGTKTRTGKGAEDWYNTALVLDGNGVIGEYYKTRPVHLFNDGIAGTNYNPIQTDLGKIATPICFDCDYSLVSRKITKLGAEFFAVPSFDNISWGKTQHLQHSMFFRLRAAENSRWLACAASSGVSQIIDPNGNVHKSIPPMDKGVITGHMGQSSRLNFFVRAGWLFPWLTMGLSIIAMLWSIYKRLKRSQQK